MENWRQLDTLFVMVDIQLPMDQ